MKSHTPFSVWYHYGRHWTMYMPKWQQRRPPTIWTLLLALLTWSGLKCITTENELCRRSTKISVSASWTTNSSSTYIHFHATRSIKFNNKTWKLKRKSYYYTNYCSPPGLRTFWKSKKKWKHRSTSTVSDPLHNFQPDPQEEVDSKTKVIVVFSLQLGKV